MRLKWNIDGNGDLLAPHPYTVDENDSPDYYRVSNFSDGEWKACIKDVELAAGSVEDCMKACNQDALAARRLMRATELMREIYSLERQEGGNWRKLSRVVRKREQLERLQRMGG